MAETPQLATYILTTKLSWSTTSDGLVPRPRLMRLLDAGLQRALTLIIAPAGFGKTTLVSAWLESRAPQGRGNDPPAAWLSLDESDSDLDSFLRYVVAALRTIFPDACPQTLGLLNALQRPSTDLFFTTLSNEIAHLPGRFILALDDFHNLHNPVVSDLLARWGRHWPAPLHLVILSRTQPPLPLADLRARGQVTELRARDLRFSPAEAEAYLRPVLTALLDDQAIQLLQQRMEGWIVALKLATLSLLRHDDPQAFTEALVQGESYIADYLLDQVFQQQSPEVQRFLWATAVPDRFSVSLAAALLDCRLADAQALMDELKSADLFIIPLDNRQEWYRFHDLFRHFLRQTSASRQPPEEGHTTHRRAARWYADHNLFDQALYHALQANDPDLTVQVMQRGLGDILNRENRPMLERWQRLLPPAFVQNNPQLMLLEAWETIFHWDFARMDELVVSATRLLADRAEQMDPAQERLLRGQLALFKGLVAHHVNQPEKSLAFCQEALELLPESWRYARGVAFSYLGLSLHTIGRAAEAEASLIDEYQKEQDRPDSYTLRILLALGINDVKSGDLERAERVAQVVCQKAGERQLIFLESWAHATLGYIHYLWNELDLAEHHFAELAQMRAATFLTLSRRGMGGLALVYQAQGNSAAARQQMEETCLFDVEMIGRVSLETAAAQARLLSLQGDAAGAERWVDHSPLPLPDRPLYPSTEEPYTTRARILILRGRPEDIQAALQLLDALDRVAIQTHTDRSRVEILALRALAEMACGQSAAARRSLKEAVSLAGRGGIIRTFVELGLPMQALLRQMATQAEVAQHVSQVLAAFSGGDEGETAVANIPFPESPLTLRELEILHLLGQRLSAKEIAAQLNLSPNTVKRHRANIYQKLGVNRLTEALAAADGLGLWQHLHLF
jgi:LuxR family transcriptional regulator, maltose regulon positive regulatory protein